METIIEYALSFFAGLCVLIVFAIALLTTFLALTVIRASWQWLTRQSWNTVIVKTERKAFRG